MNYKELAEQALDYIVEQRRWCHQNPELSLEEVQTTEHIAAELQKMGYTEIQRFPDHTGLCAMLRGGKAEKACRTVALRADIDALPVEEKTGLPFASRNKGVMHACGHDSHSSIALEVCRWLVDHKDELKGKFKVLFQPAEEGVRGGNAMAASGIVDDCDYLIGGHVGTFAKLGEVGLMTGGFLASTKIDVHFHGRPSHAGSDPEKGRSALMAACAAAMMMQGIPRSGEGVTRIAVGKLNAGEGRNVTPVHADMQLEVRGATGEVNEYMVQNVRNIVEGVKRAYEVEGEIVKAGEATTLTVCPDLIDMVEEEAKKIEGVKRTFREDKPAGSEDCTVLIKRVVDHGGKAAYFMFGCNHHGHHRADFEIQDETSMPIGFEVFCRMAKRLNGI